MNSPITRIGGKKLLRKTICERFPETGTFDRYVEVFGGAGWVLFYKDKHAKLEVYNDADGELVNLMRCIKYHAGELQREIDGYCNAREFFDDVSAQLNMRGLTEFARPRYFSAHEDLVRSRRRHKSYGCNARIYPTRSKYLTDVQRRLMSSSWLSSIQDFENLIKVYDRPKALSTAIRRIIRPEKYYDVQFHGSGSTSDCRDTLRR